VAIGKSTWWPRTTVRSVVFSGPPLSTTRYNWNIVIPPQRSCRGVYWFHHVLPSVCRQILCRTITWVVFLRILKFYPLLTGEERRIPFFFLTIFTFAVPYLLIWYDGKYNFYPMSYDNLSSVSQDVLKFYQQLTGEERRIPFIFDDFHFCRSRVVGLDMTENKIFTLCRMTTWVVFLRMFWNFISSLPVKRGGFLSILVGTIGNVLVMEIGWTDVGSGGIS
jgi:hypothetical protein